MISAASSERDCPHKAIGKDESAWYVDAICWLVALPGSPFRTLSFRYGHEPRQLIIHSTSAGYDVPTPIWSDFTGSESSLQAAKRWLLGCKSGHLICNKRPSSLSFLPSRLVDVGSPGSSPPQPPRLCTREQIAQGTHYFTLSHRWRVHMDSNTLTRNSLIQFSREIPAAAISPNFQDAMRVVRMLGYRYIWIDALCIVQDSDEDWRAECSQMGDIYRNAICNISQDNWDSLFSSRDPRSLEPIIIRSEKEDEEDHRWVIHHRIPGSETLLREAPLYTRGWVIQEWFMAPRILHFGEIITWECCEGSASEAFPTFERGRKVLNWSRKSSLIDEQLQGVSACLAAWSDLIVTYSNTGLTLPRDKLPAISAVAKEIHGHLREAGGEVEYLAGLWSQCFAQQLLWLSERNKRPPSYRAPTWSWASIDGFVKPAKPLESLEKNVIAEILQTHITPAGDDPFQEIIGAYMKVRCWLWPIRLSATLALGESEDGIVVRYDVSEEEAASARGNPPDTGYLMPVQVDAKAISQTLSLKNSRGPEVCYMPYVRVQGLVLANDATKKDLFSRIGTFIVEVDAKKIVSIPPNEDRKTTAERINTMELKEIMGPTLRHTEEILDLHSLEPGLGLEGCEERLKDTRYPMETPKQSGGQLYTITIV
ncbi:heterokaryon incompatibility protein-domain-containing protein [Macrophomina phaseolina]|uniref:Heterokaryon incompatibility protein-domain-containing protein n=1 Tax=Macrophomina phaseolina TaxID=35725 RepID=A0ABQ8G5K3_9PEZI|nr:heterokaryon incompatibility protein-domain-containing protein [Macrophomina phaseolina]